MALERWNLGKMLFLSLKLQENFKPTLRPQVPKWTLTAYSNYSNALKVISLWNWLILRKRELKTLKNIKLTGCTWPPNTILAQINWQDLEAGGRGGGWESINQTISSSLFLYGYSLIIYTVPREIMKYLGSKQWINHKEEADLTCWHIGTFTWLSKNSLLICVDKSQRILAAVL